MSGEQLYDMIPVFSGAFFVIYGLLMIISPKTMIKKEWKEEPARLAKMRRNGPLVMICGIVIIVTGIMTLGI